MAKNFFLVFFFVFFIFIHGIFIIFCRIVGAAIVVYVVFGQKDG